MAKATEKSSVFAWMSNHPLTVAIIGAVVAAAITIPGTMIAASFFLGGKLGQLEERVSNVKTELAGVVRTEVGEVRTDVRLVDGKVVATTERVSRIADALENVNVRVAAEQIRRDFPTACIVSKPAGDEVPDKWTVGVWDASSPETITVHTIPATSESWNMAYQICGMAHNLDPHSITAKEMEGYFNSTNTEWEVPTWVDTGATVLFDESKGKYLNQWIQSMGGSAQVFAMGPELENRNALEMIQNLPKDSQNLLQKID